MASKYVPIFFDWTEVTVDLNQEQKGNLIDAIVDYASVQKAEDVILVSLDGMERIAFRFLKGQVDRFIELSNARSIAGSNKKQTVTNKNKQEQQQTTGIYNNNNKNNNNNNNNNNNKNNNVIAATAASERFTKPTVEEVRAYMAERNKGMTAEDAETFVNFYESKGWKVGNQSMKDWKSAVRTWENRRKGGNGNGGYSSGRGNAQSEVRSDYSFLKS